MVTTSLGYSFAFRSFLTFPNPLSTAQKIRMIISSVVMSHLQYGLNTSIVGLSHDDFNLHHWLYNIISAVTLVDTTALSDGIPGYRWTFAAQIDGSSLPNGVQVTLFCSLLQLYLRDSTAVSSGCDFQQTYVQGDKRHVKFTFEIRDASRKDWSLDRVEYRYQTAEDIVVPITLWEASQH